MKHTEGKKTVAIVLIIAFVGCWLFGFVEPCLAQDISFDLPAVSNAVTQVTQTDILYACDISSDNAATYEFTRRQVYEKVSAQYSDTQLALLSDYAWVLYPVVYWIGANLEGEPMAMCQTVPATEESISLSLFQDILPFIPKIGEYKQAFQNGSTVHLTVALALEIDGTYEFLTGSEALGSITFPALTYIDYVCANGDMDNGENVSFAFFPTLADIKLALPKKSGYTFVSWTNDAGVNINVIPAGVSYYRVTAYFKSCTYKVRYVLTTRQGSFNHVANRDNPQSIAMDETLTLHSIDAPIGWYFEGWYLDADFTGEPLTELCLSQPGDVILYAKWLNEDEKTRQKIADAHWGDLDSDGAVTAADARLALRYAVGLEDFELNIIKRADFYAQGTVSSANARILLRIAVGLDDIKDILQSAKLI